MAELKSVIMEVIISDTKNVFFYTVKKLSNSDKDFNRLCNSDSFWSEYTATLAELKKEGCIVTGYSASATTKGLLLYG
jgi:hypothetical protein